MSEDATRPPPSISVVVPSYRRLSRLPGLVREHLAQGADEVIVVLDGPHPGWRDQLADIATLPRVIISELPRNGGLALARIAGLERATSDVVLLTDDDVQPAPGMLERHRLDHRGRADHVVLGYMPVLAPAPRGRDDAATAVYAKDYEKQVAVWRGGDATLILGSLWGGNVSVGRTLYLAAERSKPSTGIPYNEDLDLGMRLLRLGASAEFDEAALAHHLHSRGLEGFLRESADRGRAIRLLEERWGEVPPQLLPLITIPDDYRRIPARMQHAIARKGGAGATERMLVLAYRAAGQVRAWPAQDAIARFLRRPLAMRGYRLARESAFAAVDHAG